MVKKRLSKWYVFTMLLALFLGNFALTHAMGTSQQPDEVHSDFIVRGLKVEDIPDNDGSGLTISWEPLAAEARIIEYRIYRGASPDTLHYIGNIPINPTTGFAGDRVYFYDSGYNMFVDINSPGKLKQEIQQPAGSPLYQQIPRDLNITGPKLEKYNILAVIPKKEFYYKTEKIELQEGEEGEEETNYYAGLKLRQFQYLLKKLNPDQPYYYTVVAVNQQRRFFPHAPITEGIPRINSPEKTRDFFAVAVNDKERLQFEWTLPLNPDAVSTHNVYIFPKNQAGAFEEYVQQQSELEANQLRRKEDPDVEEYVPTAENPTQLVFSRGSALPYTSMNTSYIDIVDNSIIDEDKNINVPIDIQNIDQYYAVFSLRDFYGHESFSNPVSFNVINSDALPHEPDMTVIDKPNDQGDYNTVYWGKPVAFLTNTSFLNEERTRILINYEYETNKNYKISNIFFDIYDDEGNLITSVNEFYQDLFFRLKLPDKYALKSPEDDINRRINFEIRLKVRDDKLPEDYVLKQQLYFDLDYQSYRPTELSLRGDGVTNYTYYVYKKPYSGETFRQSSRAAGIIREIDDNIRYEASIFKGATKFIADSQLILVDTSINAFYDKENERSVRTSIYMDVALADKDRYRDELEKYKAEYDQAETEEERQQHQRYIDHYENILADYEHEFIQTLNEQPNDRARMKMIAERREREARTFQYKMVVTDGQGLLVETDIYQDADGNVYFFPVPNWFNHDRLPTLIASLIFGFFVFFMIRKAKRGHDFYIRPIAGLQEVDNAIGRATEMGRPIMFNPGLDSIGHVATLAGLAILGHVAKKAAEYDTKIFVPLRDYIVLPIAQEIVREAHHEAGRPDTYDKNSVFFITSQQFAFVAGVNGVMIREKCATCFYMGFYYAEALIMTETGNTIGSVQIAGSDAITQIPFFITTCDYTLIGEELYGASAYLAKEPLIMGTLKAVDATKFIILLCIIAGTLLSTVQLTFFINLFPDK
jgi:hypothetical protein